MDNVVHLRCCRCGEPLKGGSSSYCAPCNLYLAYRAMPFLLGMLLMSGLPLKPALETAGGYDNEALLIWE